MTNKSSQTSGNLVSLSHYGLFCVGFWDRKLTQPNIKQKLFIWVWILIVSLSKYFWSLKKWEAPVENVAIPTPFTWFGCKYPQIKAECLHLKQVLFVSFQIHCGGVQGQKDENSADVPIFMDLTVSSSCPFVFMETVK